MNKEKFFFKFFFLKYESQLSVKFLTIKNDVVEETVVLSSIQFD